MFEQIERRFPLSLLELLSRFSSSSSPTRFLPAALLRKSARGESGISSAWLVHGRTTAGAFIALRFAERASLPETWMTAPPPLKAKFPTPFIFLTVFFHARAVGAAHKGTPAAIVPETKGKMLRAYPLRFLHFVSTAVCHLTALSGGAAVPQDLPLKKKKRPCSESKCSTCNGASDLIISQRIIHEKMMQSVEEEDKNIQIYFCISSSPQKPGKAAGSLRFQDFILSDPSWKGSSLDLYQPVTV